ncbi:MarR family winged helix-turn-helix transcriptional regulator [Ursidibacter sp. B-7004-1]
MHQIDHIGQTASHIFNLYDAWAKAQNINYSTLAVLHSLVRLEQCTQKQICTLWALPKQTVSASCLKLYQDNVINYLPSGGDKREKMLILTEQGKDFALPLIAKLDRLEQQVINQFGKTQTDTLLVKLTEFGKTLESVMALEK